MSTTAPDLVGPGTAPVPALWMYADSERGYVSIEDFEAGPEPCEVCGGVGKVEVVVGRLSAGLTTPAEVHTELRRCYECDGAGWLACDGEDWVPVTPATCRLCEAALPLEHQFELCPSCSSRGQARARSDREAAEYPDPEPRGPLVGLPHDQI